MFWKKDKSTSRTNKSTEVTTEKKMIWRGVSATDVGMVRAQNEDAVFLSTRYGKLEFHLAIVCDGMGGHSAGEVASQMCIDEIRKTLNENEVSEKLLAQAIQSASAAIFNKASTDQTFSGMGTTCSALAVYHQKVSWAHVGDSHIYLLSDNKIKLINSDHTLEYQKKKDGLTLFPGDEHVLTMAVGTRKEINPEHGSFLIPGTDNLRFLLCTDGLYNLISEDELLILCSIESASLCAQTLIALAKERGGHDNISLCILDRIEVENDNQITKAS